jgi:mono/diheme cytochrome c family protein
MFRNRVRKIRRRMAMKRTIAAVALLTVFSSVAWSQDGAGIYKTKCAVCHGADGQGKPKVGPKLVGTTKSEEQIVALLTKGGAQKGIHIKPMNGLQENQAKAVAGFVKGLK